MTCGKAHNRIDDERPELKVSGLQQQESAILSQAPPCWSGARSVDPWESTEIAGKVQQQGSPPFLEPGSSQLDAFSKRFCNACLRRDAYASFFGFFRAIFFGALDDKQFLLCVVEGRGVALTPGVKLPGVGPPRVARQLVDSHVVDIHTVKECQNHTHHTHNTHTYTHTHTHIHTYTRRQAGRQIDRQTDRQTDGHRQRQTGTDRDRQTDGHHHTALEHPQSKKDKTHLPTVSVSSAQRCRSQAQSERIRSKTHP